MRKKSAGKGRKGAETQLFQYSTLVNQGLMPKVEEWESLRPKTGPRVMGGASMLSGVCHGGPSGGKNLHHPFPVYNVGRDRLSKRLIVGWQGGPTIDIEVGHYEYSGGAWHWHSPTV